MHRLGEPEFSSSFTEPAEIAICLSLVEPTCVALICLG
ncbi:MAG: hypothetical protein AVDCRST_MAG39-731 [uncultured Sphingomonadaceae bacterium]|uniref:Uncharacterized protein n=1 Tax=uncultured Sphingomonadaceae bacterium TaxID=169976 RepID=A0A6J4S5A9_9SPHN|nr:MAG: hypothetical protein AVDCRST_MAG39-731 [uncultured Sphingomonadaceae bacterium]